MQCQILEFGRWKTFFLFLHLADDVGVIEDPVDLSVQEFVAQKKKPNQNNFQENAMTLKT